MKKIFQWLASFFSAGGKLGRRTLDGLSAEDIRRERIKFEQTEAKITREIEELEKQKDALFAKGVKSGSERQKLQCARKIKEVEGQIQARDQQLSLISRNLRVLHGVEQLKNNERVLRDLGMEGLVKKMDLAELQRYVEEAMVEGELQMDRFNEILTTLDGAGKVYRVESDDAETLAMYESIQKAGSDGLHSHLECGVEPQHEVGTGPVFQSA